MAVAVSLINMKGGVGKTTLAFNLAWYSAWRKNLRVLAIDLDPQANLSQYFMGAEEYLAYLNADKGTVVEIFEQFSAPKQRVARVRPQAAPGAFDLEPSRTHHRIRFPGCARCAYPGYMEPSNSFNPIRCCNVGHMLALR
jgi:chromosome partitioning protein